MVRDLFFFFVYLARKKEISSKIYIYIYIFSSTILFVHCCFWKQGSLLFSLSDWLIYDSKRKEKKTILYKVCFFSYVIKKRCTETGSVFFCVCDIFENITVEGCVVVHSFVLSVLKAVFLLCAFVSLFSTHFLFSVTHRRQHAQYNVMTETKNKRSRLVYIIYQKHVTDHTDKTV